MLSFELHTVGVLAPALEFFGLAHLLTTSPPPVSQARKKQTKTRQFLTHRLLAGQKTMASVVVDKELSTSMSLTKKVPLI